MTASQFARFVGVWTLPYKHPRGTKAAQVTRVDDRGIAYLSDGTSLHVSHVRPCAEGTVAGGVVPAVPRTEREILDYYLARARRGRR